MLKLFSVAEANALIPTVAAVIDDMQAAASDLQTLQARLQTTPAHSVQGRNLVIENNFLAVSLHENHQRLEQLGVLLQDLARGIVVFPTLLGAEVVYLCWQPGETTITHYYGVFQPVRGDLEDRLPLPASKLLADELPIVASDVVTANAHHA
jgi:hypothetical protein